MQKFEDNKSDKRTVYSQKYTLWKKLLDQVDDIIV